MEPDYCGWCLSVDGTLNPADGGGFSFVGILTHAGTRFCEKHSQEFSAFVNRPPDGWLLTKERFAAWINAGYPDPTQFFKK